jgi:hypothetical protein
MGLFEIVQGRKARECPAVRWGRAIAILQFRSENNSPFGTYESGN